jgi:hypothetical protein
VVGAAVQVLILVVMVVVELEAFVKISQAYHQEFLILLQWVAEVLVHRLPVSLEQMEQILVLVNLVQDQQQSSHLVVGEADQLHLLMLEFPELVDLVAVVGD